MSHDAAATLTPISNRLPSQFKYQRMPSQLMPMPMPTNPERVLLPEVGIQDVFDIRIATDEETENAAFGIRYQVFSKELGWELTSSAEREFGVIDQRSVQVVAFHRASGRAVACYRLILADPTDTLAPFPVEACCPRLVRGSFPETGEARLGCAEISRFCSLPPFRSFDAISAPPPWGISAEQWASESRHRLGLANLMWMTLAYIASYLRLDYLFAITEARMQQASEKIGFNFQIIGPQIHFYGPRVPCRIDRRSFRAPLLVPQTAALLKPFTSTLHAGMHTHPLLASYVSSRTANSNRG